MTQARKNRNKGTVEADVRREFYTVGEFAAACCLSTETVYNMRRRGALHAVRLGGEWRIPYEEIDRLKNEAREQAEQRRPA